MYSIAMDISPDFARQLKAKGQVYVETMDGRIIPMTAVPKRIDQPEPPAIYTVPVSFTSNLNL